MEIVKILNKNFYEAKDKQCSEYMVGIKPLIDRCSNDEERKILNLISDVLSYNLINEKSPCFQPAIIWEGKRSASIEDLTIEDKEILKDIEKDIEDYEFKARVCDIIWTLDREYLYAQEAINGYIESAKRLYNEEHWVDSLERIRRGVNITKELGKKNAYRDICVKYIKELIEEANDKESYAMGKLMEILQELKAVPDKMYFEKLEDFIEYNIGCKEYSRARYYVQIIVNWHKLEQDKELEVQGLKRIAGLFVEEAEVAISEEKNPQQIVHLYECGIEAYRKTPNVRKEIEDILTLLKEYKKSIADGLKCFNYTIDADEIVRKMLADLKGLSFEDTITKIAFLDSFLQKNIIRDRVIQLYKQSPLSFLVSVDIIDGNGKRICRMPDLNVEDVNQYEKALDAHMLREATNEINLLAAIFINTALKFVREEFEIRIESLRFLVDDNVFIPKGRKEIFLKGIYKGIKGDVFSAVHILIPQLEEAIRELAQNCGDIITTFDDNGEEEVKSFNTILELKNFVQAIDENMLFTLRAAFTEKYGLNLRNRLAHGLLSDAEINSSALLYGWWICLKLACMYSKCILGIKSDKE